LRHKATEKVKSIAKEQNFKEQQFSKIDITKEQSFGYFAFQEIT
jgi:hypothetical protein